MSARIIVGDVREKLRDLGDESVHCVVTSPPYWGLRDYGVEGQLGLEETPEQYVETLVAVFREVRRVLREDGTMWLNLGDSYATAGGPGWQGKNGQRADRTFTAPTGTYKGCPPALKPKDLVGIPWRVAFALQADGWWLRSDIIWAKPNPMPESVTDRPTKSHEYLFLLARSERYFYDYEAIKEPDAGSDHRRNVLHRPEPSGGVMSPHEGIRTASGRNGSGRNRRSVWTITTKPFPEAHFATFPPDLVRPCIKAGTSERGCCTECGAPWKRVVERTSMEIRPSPNREAAHAAGSASGRRDTRGTMTKPPTSRTVGWEPGCDCDDYLAPCVVLDPFTGSGTTGIVANEMGREFVGIELNPEYAEMARRRVLGTEMSLFTPGHTTKEGAVP